MPAKQKTLTNSGKPDNAFRDFKDIEDEYRHDPSIFATDVERVAALKYIIDHKLSRVDKTLILIYADCQSFRKMGKRLGFSHTTMRCEIKRIKALILDEYNKMQKR